MNPTYRIAALWGLIIGVANMLWLYLAYYLGLHTSGIVIFQLFMLGWLCLTSIGFVLMLRAVRRRAPSWGYWRGVGVGAVAAVVSAVIAVVAQVGYFKVVHPEWPEFMAEHTREHFTAKGAPPEEVEQMVAEARRTVTLPSYAVSSAMVAFVTGVVLSAIIMIFLRRRSPRAPALG